MGGVISKDEAMAARGAAIEYALTCIGQGDGYINPNAKIGSLSGFEWNKLAEHIVSGWIIERSRQLTAERLTDEQEFLAIDCSPSPRGLGIAAATLPKLGAFCEQEGLSGKPINQWTKPQVLRFVWAAKELFMDAESAAKERPAFVSGLPDRDLMMAG